MPNNDEVVFGIPSIQCPSCGATAEISSKNRIDKFSKEQRKRMTRGGDTYSTASTPSRFQDPFPNGEDQPSEFPEKNFVVISCSNFHCEQYNKFKVLKIPRIHTPSVKVDLGD
jgi:hypothetical protein